MIGDPDQLPRGLMAGMAGDVEAPVQNGTRPGDGRMPERVGDDDDDGIPNVEPEEQAAYEEFVEMGLSLVYRDGEVNPGILQLLDADPSDLLDVFQDAAPELRENFNPVVALAATTVVVVLEVLNRLPQHPDGAILMHGGKELLEDLANLSEEARQHVYTEGELQKAFLHAVDLYQAVSSANGTLDRELASREFADILNAEEQGKLGTILPELERAAQ